MQRVHDTIKQYPVLFSFGLVGIMWIMSVTAWIQSTPDALTMPSAYDIFPVFGLMAFSALLSTYVVNAVSTHLKIPGKKLAAYYQNISYVILILILTHPSTLIARLFMDGYGLPPGSYAAYVNEKYLWVVWLGVISLLVFLAFEFHRWFSRKGWWKWVVYANDIAMLFVFYHGLTLGTELQKGWFRYVWWLYGVILIATIVYLRFIAKRTATSSPVS